MTHLILGGARSGKTAFALSVAEKTGFQKCMIVTATADDPEMLDRIALHRAERSADWLVVEEAQDLCGALRSLVRSDRVVVVDCLTLWLSNLFFVQKDWMAETVGLATIVKRPGGRIILVSNEIGFGLAPVNDLGRAFRDAHGRMNQIVAKACDEATMVVAGLPIALKSGRN
ncbi:bifunctional adenosylcobinamide kinase/adenosylcobinamide-phosphate guanylyltransferase [uncultured Rhodoblastus sp.]|uniref:bifunctional adenosylcobinamide kinase/adenosylcobinamide-phosphate guanylyltransferase n=1 Tax=uncultured Rhodoblastus sp. TaxID=543037 RepID=UPI0025FF4DA8|nr:bifunctional adenosylcobinamide kinase/adenosylcobinamide-phosphate guanylyltransferase [uncultured Rhodoblastus sp.]